MDGRKKHGVWTLSGRPVGVIGTMKTLVIETSTAACSVALIQSTISGDTVIASAHEVVGRGHAERLIPMIAELPDGGRANRILVDCGPGSFTGVRVGIAAARGLAFGWGAEVHGFSALPLVAAAAFAVRPLLDSREVVVAAPAKAAGAAGIRYFRGAPGNHLGAAVVATDEPRRSHRRQIRE